MIEEDIQKPSLEKSAPSRPPFLMVLTSLVLIFILSSYPVYLLWRKRQLSMLTTQAEEYLKQEKWEQAYAILSAAYSQAPADPTVLRKIARLTQRTNQDPERALFFWRQLLVYTSLTTEDWAKMGEAFLLDGQPNEVLKILETFTPAQRSSKYSIELESQLLCYQEKPSAADALRRKYFLQNPHDPENQLNLAILDLKSPFTEVRQNALKTLLMIARDRGRHSAAAIQTIAASPLLTRGMSSEIIELASKDKTITEKKYLEILGRHLFLNPLSRDAIYSSEIARHQNKSLEECVVFYHWLLQQDEYDRVLALVTRDKATRNNLLFPIYVEALAGKSRWDELSDIFQRTPGIPLTATDQSILQARIANGQGKNEDIVSGHLKEACRRALIEKNIEAIQRIVTMADKLGFVDLAIDMLVKASVMPQYQLTMLERLLGIYSRRGDTESMLKTTQQILEARPMMKSHMANALYLKLLLGKELEGIAQNTPVWAAQEKISRDSLPVINALTAYRFHDFLTLRGALSKIEIDKLTVGQRAVYAGMLASCGEQAQAFMLAEKIAPTLLLKEEVVFLRKAL